MREPPQAPAVRPLVRLALALALMVPAAAARAQPPRPEVFFVLGRAEAPPVSSAALPPRARAAYARTLELRSTARAVAGLPGGEVRRARLERLDAALAEAFGELERALGRERAALDASGWRVLGEARMDRAIRAYLDLLDAHDADPERAPMPAHAELGPAALALRVAAALAPRPEDGAWARYLEAWCRLEMGQEEQAAAALRIVAASGPPALRQEARFRLGELAYDDGRFGEASGWYERASRDADERYRELAIYKLAWARFFAGDRAGALAAVDRAPAGARPEVRADLARLRDLAHAAP